MSEELLLDVRDLSVSFGNAVALDKVSLEVRSGETLAVVGESGSGKSTAAMAAAGMLGDEATVVGSTRLFGHEITSASEAERRRWRGDDMAIVFQDPFTSLNPGMTIGRQVAETLIFHRGADHEVARRQTIEVLGEVGLPDPESLLEMYPHQLSGGMQQRVLIASALICDPKLLVLDEPTTALDVTVEARILDLLDDIRRRRGLGMLFITHNLGVVNRVADRVCVLYAGRVAETGTKTQVLGDPAHPYTKGLLASLPKLAANHERAHLAPIPGRMPAVGERPRGCVFQPRCPFAADGCAEPQELRSVRASQKVRCWKADRLQDTGWPAPTPIAASRKESRRAHAGLAVEDLRKRFPGARLNRTVWRRKFGIPLPEQARRTVHAVNGVSLSIAPGEVLGLVGESGSGKSTLGQAVVGLLDYDAGKISFAGEDIGRISGQQAKNFHKRVQIVFQNPDSSLNPRRTVGDAIARAVSLHADIPRKMLGERVAELLDRVGLSADFAPRYPHQLSGGERQRVGIARALATEPEFILCDEPTSALDVSVQATVLNILSDLREQENLSYLFISHDLAVVSHISDKIAVMYAGAIVESGPTEQVLHPPYHPYTEALLSAASVPDPQADHSGRITLRSDATPTASSVGCPFSSRCPRRLGSICDEVMPPERRTSSGHVFTCHIEAERLVELQSSHVEAVVRTEKQQADSRPADQEISQ